MAESLLAELATLVIKFVSLATEEVVWAWKIHEDLETLGEMLESINALLSDAATKKITMSAVQKWFNILEADARLADTVIDELFDEVTRRKEKNHHRVWDFFIPSKNTILYRLKVAGKIKFIHASRSTSNIN